MAPPQNTDLEPGATQPEVAQSLSDLHSWLQSMRQTGGFGGPVAHWWQSRYQYTGPGLDWRYEGILTGYSNLLAKTGNQKWVPFLRAAADDLIYGQRQDGSYAASCFELNPGTLGTPHEAAATLGFIRAVPYLAAKEQALVTAQRNLRNIVDRLWDERTSGFNDRPGVKGRVPNKLATLALAFLAYTEATATDDFLPYARSAVEDMVRYQVRAGELNGAIHQYAAAAGHGDERFFPFYNARCIPTLVKAGAVFNDPRYREAAERILQFLRKSMHRNGSWPQIIYGTGRRAEWPRWVAGQADILLAFQSMGEPIPTVALRTLLAGQTATGAFRTGIGFSSQISQLTPGAVPDFRDVSPVVGWNDKVFRLLTELLIPNAELPLPRVSDEQCYVLVRTRSAVFSETGERISVVTERGECLFAWNKREPWAQVRGVVGCR